MFRGPRLPDLSETAPFFYRGLALLACRFPAHDSYRITAAQVAAPLALAALALVGVYVPAVCFASHRHPHLLPHVLFSVVALFAYTNLTIAVAVYEPAAAHLCALLFALHVLHAVRVSLTSRDALAPRDLMPGQTAARTLLRATELGVLGTTWFLAPTLSAGYDSILYCTLAPEPVGLVLNVLLAPLAWWSPAR
jgi:hypothetical protein